MTEGRARSSRLLKVALLLAAGLVAAEVGVRLYAGVKGVGASELGSLVGGEPTETARRSAELTRSGIVRPSAHDELIYELKPGVRGTLGARLVHTNSHGMRDREIELRKPENTFRIVGLGDSHMFGTGVAQGQTYLDLLERRLNAASASGHRYETLNFATPGFNTAQEVAMLEHRALEFDPDLVILHFINDDLGAPRYLRDPSARAGGARSYLLGLLAALNRSEDEEEAAPPLLMRASDAGESLLEELGGNDYLAGQEGAHRALERLARLADERDIPVVVLMLGDGGAVRGAVRELAERLGFHFVNALPHFRERLLADGSEPTREEWRSAYFQRGDLPTELAHQVYAEALLEKVRELEPAAGS